jgi:gas vesicle protein
MTESIAIVGFIASVVQLVDFSSKVLHRLSEFRSSLDKVPKSFRDIRNQLPLLVESIEQTKKQTEDGHFSKNTQEAVWSVVKGCQSQVEQLNDILEEILPVAGCSSWKRGKMAILSIYEQKKVQQITTAIQEYVQILTYHQATSLLIGPY